jgi:hypothetical protein
MFKIKGESYVHYLYYPGCTLYTKAKSLDRTARNCSLLLGLAMGLDYRTLGFEQNAVDPLPLLKEKGLL